MKFLAALAALAALALTACATGTVVPHAVIASTPSIDPSGHADSGVIEVIANAGYVVTPHWRDRYNALVAIYGHDPLFLPPLKPDDGIEADGANFFVQTRYATYFGLMNGWNKKRSHQPRTLLQKATGL